MHGLVMQYSIYQSDARMLHWTAKDQDAPKDEPKATEAAKDVKNAFPTQAVGQQATDGHGYHCASRSSDKGQGAQSCLLLGRDPLGHHGV